MRGRSGRAQWQDANGRGKDLQQDARALWPVSRKLLLHWPTHKEACNVVVNAASFFDTLVTEGGNRSLCSFVEEHDDGQRGMVHFKFPSPAALEKMVQRKGVQTMPADTQFIPLDRLQLYDRTAQAEIQNFDFWNEVLNVAATYDVDLHICLLLSVTLSDGRFCRPAVVPKFFGSGSF